MVARGEVLGYDGFGVAVRSVLDVFDGFVEGVDHLYGEVEGEVFVVLVVVCRRLYCDIGCRVCCLGGVFDGFGG